MRTTQARELEKIANILSIPERLLKSIWDGSAGRWILYWLCCRLLHWHRWDYVTPYRHNFLHTTKRCTRCGAEK